MAAIPNSYKRGDLKGLGFEADFGGVRVHCIAWEDAQVERLRDNPVFTEGLIIDSLEVKKGVPYEQMEHAMEFAKPFADSAEFYKGVVGSIGEMFGDVAKTSDDGTVQESVLALKVPELVKGLIEGFKELEKKLSESIPIEFQRLHGEALPDGSVEVFAPIGTVPPEVITEAIPEVLTTSEPITPAVTETPAVTTQEPVVASASEKIDSSTAAAPDLPSDEEAWKPVPGESEAQTVRSYLTQFGIGKPTAEVIAALKEFGVVVSSSQVAVAKKELR